MPRMTLFRKILAVTLLLSMLPLLASSLLLMSNLESVTRRLTGEIADSADQQASQTLQMRARHVADTIADFLHQCESDLTFLASTPLNRQSLLTFYNTRCSEVWEIRGPSNSPQESHEIIPLYRSIAFIDRQGQERLVIRDGRFAASSELRKVSRPADTEFKNEDYFQSISNLKKGQIYVSHLTGFHVSKAEQLGNATEPEYALDGATYEGVIRFGTPLYNQNGQFNGMVVISLDHRHLMEFTQHIDPGQNFSTPFPSYKSGNYAFLFDDEGWIITHPKYWDIRGVDHQGKLLPPYSEHSSKADIEAGRIPYNLDHAGFIHPNYPVVANKVRNHISGYVDITNVGGAKKIMAYAPIQYDTGDYSRYGIFGGVTIGFQVDQFHDAANRGSSLINRELRGHRTRSAIIILAAAILAGVSSWLLSRGITSPVQQLTEGAQRLASGDTLNAIAVTSKDELGELAQTFNNMAAELERRKRNLLTAMDELRCSRQEIIDERNFKASVLESISSAILTFSPAGALTSINSTGYSILGENVVLESHYREVFSGWGDMAERIERVRNGCAGYGRQPLRLERPGGVCHFDVGLFPIGSNAELGLTVTMRNETEKEKLREEMIRLDRLASLGKLAAGIAHEVRNPLTGIALLLDDLHDQAALAADDQAMLKKALTEIERVEKLINALLNYSSPPRADFRLGDINGVVNDTALLMKRECERRKVTIDVTSVPIPTFSFDPEKIRQALMNIIRNALEAMPDGGAIKVGTGHDGDQALIRIADNGPGISPEDLPLIFEPFFTRKGAGTGLGLSITQRVVEEHKGTISVESSHYGGTVFTLKLPMTGSSIGEEG